MTTTDSTLVNIRCPLYGFISLTPWQRAIVDHPAYQRLRRIRQLGMADLVYPSVAHTRFEHSLGVFRMATRLFDGLRDRSGDLIRDRCRMSDEDLDRMRHLVQIAALCHDVGHAPLSHLSESLMPADAVGKQLKHESYSAAVLREKLTEVIDHHPANRDWQITADEVVKLLIGENLDDDAAGKFWSCVLSGQVDADRMDYLLRDSLHAGVTYGHYDWPRILLTATAVEREDGSLAVGVDEGGWHAAETLLLARYASFTQIYYHRTLYIFELFARRALKSMLPQGVLPGPHDLDTYLAWDDWRFWGELANGQGDQWGEFIRERQPYAVVFSTPEVPTDEDRERLRAAEEVLGDLCVHRGQVTKSGWYDNQGSEEILVRLTDSPGRAVPLSQLSRTVTSLREYDQTRLYVEREYVDQARRCLSVKNLVTLGG